MSENGDVEISVLHWNDGAGRWTEIDFQRWSDFRLRRGDDYGLPDLGEGTHHFVVVVLDDDGSPANLIHHQYRLDREGREVFENRAQLTDEESAEYDRIMRSPTAQPGDREAINRIRDKLAFADNLPRVAHEALRPMLPRTPRPGSAAAKFLDVPEAPVH